MFKTQIRQTLSDEIQFNPITQRISKKNLLLGREPFRSWNFCQAIRDSRLPQLLQHHLALCTLKCNVIKTGLERTLALLAVTCFGQMQHCFASRIQPITKTSDGRSWPNPETNELAVKIFQHFHLLTVRT